MRPIVIIGGGHNGLIAAFYLAKAGLKPLVLEARDTVGGGARTDEIHAGFRCPTLTHHTCLWADIAREMNMSRHGVEWLAPPTELFAPDRDRPALVVHAARGDAAGIEGVSNKDAVAFAEYCGTLRRLASVLSPLLASPTPNLDRPTATDVWRLLKTGRAFRALGRRDAYRLLRWAPMPVADLTQECFESSQLCAAVAARGISGVMLGTRSAGSGLVLLLEEAHRLRANGATRVRGGPGALTRALASAAQAAGAEIRTGASVDRIIVNSERTSGVVVGDREIAAAAVISAVDPKTTFLRLVDPTYLSPDFLLKIRNYRASGTVAKVNLALSALPAFRGNHGGAAALSGRIHIGPDLDYLEHAFDHVKYGELSDAPWLDVTIPSILDPDLAPPGGHAMSIYVHYAPYALRAGNWSEAKPELLDRTLAVLERYAPGVKALVVAAQVITPAELETEYGMSGGHFFHGELTLDQLFTMRPLLGYGGHHAPVAGLYLCSAGSHPGGFFSGGSGRLAARRVAQDLKART